MLPSSTSESLSLAATTLIGISSSESDSILRLFFFTLKEEFESTDDTEDDLGGDFDFNLDLLRDPEADCTEEPDWERDESLEERDLDLELRSVLVDSLGWKTSLSSIDAPEELIASKIKIKINFYIY